MNEQAVMQAANLLAKQHRAVLGTQSQAMPGFPFTSELPYCLTREGTPLLLISRLAQHTRNLVIDNRCSLLISDRTAENEQATPRLTLQAQALRIEPPEQTEDCARHFYRYFPDYQDFHRVYDFEFWRLQPVRWRFIGGFADARWMSADDIPRHNPFWNDESLIRQINGAHSSQLKQRLLKQYPESVPDTLLIGIDTHGCHIRCARALYWLAHPEPCNSRQQILTDLL